VTDTPDYPDNTTGAGWTSDGWDAADLYGPPPGWPNPTFGQRARHLRDLILAVAEEAYTAAAAWWEPRWENFQAGLDDHREFTSRCGQHPDDIAIEHGNGPLRRSAVATWSTARAARTVLAVITTLAGLLLFPVFASWRPYATVQHWLGRTTPAWMSRGGHPHTPGQHVVAWLATSPALSVLVFLLAASAMASTIHAITIDARHGYIATGSRIVLTGALAGLAAGIWQPVAHATGHLFGAGAGTVGGFAAAAVIGLAWQAFGAATRRQATAVRHLNHYTAAAAILAENSTTGDRAAAGASRPSQ
jgi:hypothetical protein